MTTQTIEKTIDSLSSKGIHAYQLLTHLQGQLPVDHPARIALETAAQWFDPTEPDYNPQTGFCDLDLAI